MSDLPGFDAEAAAASVRLSRFGGWLDRRAPGEPPGFFRTTKVGDRWWLVDPDGYLFLHVAMNGLAIGKGPQAEAAFDRTFADADAWRDQATAQMWDLGFNGTGAWSDDKVLATAPRRLAYALGW